MCGSCLRETDNNSSDYITYNTLQYRSSQNKEKRIIGLTSLPVTWLTSFPVIWLTSLPVTWLTWLPVTPLPFTWLPVTSLPVAHLSQIIQNKEKRIIGFQNIIEFFIITLWAWRQRHVRGLISTSTVLRMCRPWFFFINDGKCFTT
jgi:hypothetical protein